ncbi:hemolytic protein HlpA-like protein [filamentous cyanobacterium CCP3]|nr:hemolytic protein HlpA-like protein [filamentous cyanobacterium CCP3]
MTCLTPVVFVIFRRPDLTTKVFEAIRQAQPVKLLVVADGPRNEEEVQLCQHARAVTENIDWDCEILRNYSSTNVGCRNRVSSGISWAFEHVEEAIILEDDCLPHPSFFCYCETLLEYYRHDTRIMVVSGNNFQDGQQRTPYSYYFSKYNHCWGWATWRRAWKYWELDSQKWLEFRDEGLMRSACDNPREEKYWTSIFNTLFLEGKPDSWAYPWTFACWSHGGLTVLPNVNLVSNLGFGEGATHTGGDSKFAKMPMGENLPISHPPFVVQHKLADRYTFDHVFGKVSQKWPESKLAQILINLRQLKQKLFSKYV